MSKPEDKSHLMPSLIEKFLNNSNKLQAGEVLDLEAEIVRKQVALHNIRQNKYYVR